MSGIKVYFKQFDSVKTTFSRTKALALLRYGRQKIFSYPFLYASSSAVFLNIVGITHTYAWGGKGWGFA